MSQLPADDGERPGFAVPWHAEAYAMVQVLMKSGVINPTTWPIRFGEVLRAHPVDHGEDENNAYFEALVTAMSEALLETGALEGPLLEGRIAAWRRAYEETPHGKPVRLSPLKGCATPQW